MCGIAGIIHSSASAPLIKSMTDVMYLRGPDDEGFHIEPGIAMGMRRLSIIDLSNGSQPFYSSDKSIVAFQNGEIYNHRSLQKQLEAKGYSFQTGSDTEVLAHGYHAWGIEGLARRLDGMYAVAILDRNKQDLYLVRDRYGEKPLYIAQFNDGFAYASDMRVLAALPDVSLELSPAGLNNYLALHYVPGRQTILTNVVRVLPGEIAHVCIDKKVPSFSSYYTRPIGSHKCISDNELADILESAVKSRLIADVPVGVLLSGGLDSSIVAAIAARNSREIQTFSMGFSTAEYDESEHAKIVAKEISSKHHHFNFDEQNFLELLPKVASSLDEPIGDQALLPVFWLCQEASKYVKVVLSGEGADEIFAGYGYYSQFSISPTIKNRLRALLKRPVHYTANRLIQNSNTETPSGFPLLTDTAGRTALLGAQDYFLDEWEEGLFQWLNKAADPLQRATCADLATWLPDNLLVKFDRMSMANSIEGRAPFLAPSVIEAGTARLKQFDRMKGSASKIALRRVARRWLPDSILKRDKKGFVLPMQNWIRVWADERGNVERYFKEVPNYGVIFASLGKDIASSIETDQQGRERYHFAAIMLCEWAYSFSKKVDEISNTYLKAANL